MREIKFRVFDKDLKIMHICGEDVHDGISFTNKDNKAYYYNLQNGEGSLNENSTYDLMQYTGLHDKNGKEIYEGDIVNIDLLDVNLLNVKGLVQYEEEYAQFVIVGTGTVAHEYEELGDYIDYEIEVIGNIYENSNLLKE